VCCDVFSFFSKSVDSAAVNDDILLDHRDPQTICNVCERDCRHHTLSLTSSLTLSRTFSHIQLNVSNDDNESTEESATTLTKSSRTRKVIHADGVCVCVCVCCVVMVFQAIVEEIIGSSPMSGWLLRRQVSVR